MKTAPKSNVTILALFPTAYGVGYALFYTPKKLVEYGLGHIRPVNSQKSLERVRQYLSYYEPDIVLLRGFKKNEAKTYKRTEKLIRTISKEAEKLGLKVFFYTRDEIKEVFAQFGRNSKYEISQKIIEWYPQLGIVHYYLTQ